MCVYIYMAYITALFAQVCSWPPSPDLQSPASALPPPRPTTAGRARSHERSAASAALQLGWAIWSHVSCPFICWV